MSLDLAGAAAAALPHPLPRRMPDRDAVVGTLVAAFAGDGAARMFYPGEDEYRRHFPGFLTAFGGKAFAAGTVDVDPLDRGAALWFPPGVAPDEEAIMDCLATTIPPERLDPLVAGMEAQGALHPHAPHWYLPWIGVVPEAQGRGIGAALLRRRLRLADAQGMPCYLEATNRRNARLYGRHGFEVLGIVETPGYPEIIAMWRPAATEAMQ
jgi:ribosomal protein S18 acetylase RimI-like enzyme